ncbi:hypothetical protein [Nodularia spumigena]|jgi:hypothetical protein|nr:hypothetical protein NSP_39570 [Nodularia spumigena CCY9414]
MLFSPSLLKPKFGFHDQDNLWLIPGYFNHHEKLTPITGDNSFGFW